MDALKSVRFSRNMLQLDFNLCRKILKYQVTSAPLLLKNKHTAKTHEIIKPL